MCAGVNESRRLFYLNAKGIKPLLWIGLLYCLTVGCAAVPHSTLTEAQGIDAHERTLRLMAEKEQATLEAGGFILEDQKLEHYFQDILAKIAPADPEKKRTFRIKVVKDPVLNAVSFPNGFIYIHTGLLARLESEAQLAALIAHEISHCTRQHSLRAVKAAESLKITHAVLKQEASRYGRGEILPGPFEAAGPAIASSGFYRDLETEADRGGLELIAGAGYEMREALRIFDHLKHELTAEMEADVSFDTHRELDKRIENCRDFLDKANVDENERITNRMVFLDKIKQVVIDNAFLDLKAGRFGSARRGAEKYRTIAGEDPRLYFLLGEIARQMGGKEANQAAKAFYEKAVSMNPSYPDPHKAIGLIHYKEGQCEPARRSFEFLLSISPHLPERSYIHSYLKDCSDKETEP